MNEVQREIVATAGLGDDPGGAVTPAAGTGTAGAKATERFESWRRSRTTVPRSAALVGQAAGAPNLAPDAVNVPMIRHWVEAMGDHNPVYVSERAARAAGYDELIAPPTMLQAWIMRGLRASLLTEEARAQGSEQGSGSNEKMMALLDDEGLTSVVATNCEQHYHRPLVVGDRLLVRSVIEAISDPKRTGLGTGRFITTRLDYVAVPDADVPVWPATEDEVQALYDAGEPVATMRFRILKYLPPARSRRSPATPTAGHHPGQRVLVRGCPRAQAADSALHLVRDPPSPAAASLRRLRLAGVGHRRVERPGHAVLLRRGALPAGAPFEYPLPIGLVELEEGTRVVANLDGMDLHAIAIGLPVEAEFVDFDEELSLPVFVPAGTQSGKGS